MFRRFMSRIKLKQLVFRVLIVISLCYFLKLKLNSCQKCEKIFYEQNEPVVIFDTNNWRSVVNDSNYCEVPDDLKRLSMELCPLYNRFEGDRLPCKMIFSSESNGREIKCFPPGRFRRTKDQNENDSITCRIGHSLDLLRKTKSNTIFPSILFNGFSYKSPRNFIKLLNEEKRSKQSLWAFYFNLEPIISSPWAKEKSFLELFNFTFGFQRKIYEFIPPPWLIRFVSSLVPGRFRMTVENAIKSKKPIISNRTKIKFWPKEKKNSENFNVSDPIQSVTSPILWMNSNCRTKSNRTEYMNELMKYIPVDNYGNCGDNRIPLPDSIVQIQQSANCDLRKRRCYRWAQGKLTLAQNYLFTIAIENSFEFDYITEKFWQPFIAGSVPIYLGAPNIDDWLPCRDCFIDLRKFSTIKQAANFIENLSMNKTLYETFHQWRTRPIEPKFRKILDFFDRMNQHNVECILCDASHRVRRGETVQSIKNELKLELGSF